MLTEGQTMLIELYLTIGPAVAVLETVAAILSLAALWPNHGPE